MRATEGAPVRGERWRRYLPWIVALLFSVSGVIHLVHPSTFTRIVPHFLPLRTDIVRVSGVAELICAYGLWRQRHWAGIAAAILLVVIWPANLQDAITADNVTDWVRFPLQIPLIWFALQSRPAGHGRATVGRAETPPSRLD